MDLNPPAKPTPTPYAQETGFMSFAGNSHRRWWLGLIAILILAIAAYRLMPRPSMTGTTDSAKASAGRAHRGIPVTAAHAQRGELNRYITAIGSVTAFNTVTVKTQVNGQLVKVVFTEGQSVHKGDLLAEIDPRPYQVQLLQAEGNLARDKATLANARATLRRDRELYAENVIARQDLDNESSTVGQYQGTIIADQAAINSAKLELTYCHITAPLTGRIGLRLVDQGNYVQTSDPTGIAVVTQLQPIAVDFSIAEDDLPQIQSALREGRQLPVDAYDRDLKRKLAAGYLATMNNQIDQTTGTIKLKAVFPNTDSALFPNQFVNARLLVGTDHNTVLAPAAAVQRSSQTSTFVYVVKPDQTVEARIVTIGASEGDLVSIQSGLNPGDIVVTSGTDKLEQGTKVSVQLVADLAAGGNGGASGATLRDSAAGAQGGNSGQTGGSGKGE